MAMYYQGSSEIQGDGLQTLYLMNPNYVGFSDTTALPPQSQQQSPMMFLNSANALSAGGVPHARLPQSQHFVGVPLSASSLGSAALHDPNRSLWTAAVDQTGGGGGGTTDFASQLGFHRSVVMSSPTAHQQGLSLSLSPQQQLLSARAGAGHDNIRDSGASSSSIITNGISGGLITGSKYLKAAQELLDEVVNVEKSIKLDAAANKEKVKMKKESMPPFGGGGGDPTSGGESSAAAPAAELTTAQRQDLQMKKAKLLSMLDEVEQRYRQYHHQMQVIVASFEQAAGIGSAKLYTHLALNTISKQFRCLKVAIASQIKATSKNLGEEDQSLLGGSSRLKFIDHQQRALHHLGMMQPNAWRPQRGLPERAVSVLRAWLFEHFLHPYPKDSDKIMLAKQTGLTRSQVSNWFINARVRLWKPMVEEMYMEEMKGGQEQYGGAEENTTKRSEANKEICSNNPSPTKKQEKPSNIIQDNNMENAGEISTSIQPHHGGAFSFINAGERSGKKPRNDIQSSPSSILSGVDMDMKSNQVNKGYNHNSHRFTADRQPAAENYPDLMAANASGFGGFTLGDFGRFNPENLAAGFHGNGVSLTLGLPPSENLAAVSESQQQNYLSTHQDMELGRRLEMGRMGIDNNNNPQQPSSHSNINGYETIDFQNGKRFAAQLLPDFVT